MVTAGSAAPGAEEGGAATDWSVSSTSRPRAGPETNRCTSQRQRRWVHPIAELAGAARIEPTVAEAADLGGLSVELLGQHLH